MARTLSKRRVSGADPSSDRRRIGGDPFATRDRGAIGEQDVYLLREGTHTRLYQLLGSQPRDSEEGEGTRFAVWAPNAEAVSVIGEFNGWAAGHDALERRTDGSGVWEGCVREAEPGMLYKYRIDAQGGRFSVDRGDPFARWWELPPGTASRIWQQDHAWGDDRWMQERPQRNAPSGPLSVYEVHLGAWRRVILPGGGTRFLTYREAADALVAYVSDLGFTHVELLPVMEHPHYESLGYDTSGYFAPTARYGRPEDFMYLIDLLHQRGIGVILDWVPSHFAGDAEGMRHYDGYALFEHAGRTGADVGTEGVAFDYARPEVRSFLLSAALFWLDRYHADGLRLDGVGSMLRGAGNDGPRVAGLLRELNAAMRHEYPDTLCISGDDIQPWREAGSAQGGDSGFALAWDRAWVRGTLDHFAQDPYRRMPREPAVRFGSPPSAAEGLVLPLSHDVVGSGQGSLLGRMPGDEWQRRAHMRLLLGLLVACPGKKLLFMGGEFGQLQEWRPQFSLDWHLLEEAGHRGIKTWVRDLNRLYRRIPALYQRDADPSGTARVDIEHAADGVVVLLRRGSAPDDLSLAAFNFMPQPVRDCRVGVPRGGWWHEVLNSDAWMYGGSGQGNLGGADADPVPVGEHYSSLLLTLPPLGVIFLSYQGQGQAEPGR